MADASTRRRVLVAPDSFKGTLSADEAAAAIARGLRAPAPGQDPHEAARNAPFLDLCPLSDGGEGFLATVARGGDFVTVLTTNALGDPIEATYGRLDAGRTLVVELSAAAGLPQITVRRRNPLATTTYGVGVLIKRAWEEQPFTDLLLALGGSATVDGGVGLLEALGVRFLDAEGRPLPLGGGGLVHLAKVDTAGAVEAVKRVRIKLAVDVNNPLLGPRGAATVFGPQKGANATQVALLESGLTCLADVLEAKTGVRTHDMPGCGAAGGVPASLVALTKAEMLPGFEMVAEAVKLDERLSVCDVVVTGEGRLDLSSFEGKVVGSLAVRCQALGKPLLVIAGSIDPDAEAKLAAYGGAALALAAGPITLKEARNHATTLLTAAATVLARSGHV